MLRVDGLSVEGKNKEKLLDKVTIDISKGESIGLTGPSGSGKTTLLKSIMGILDGTCTITEGNIKVDDINIEELKYKERRRICGRVLGFIPQNPMTAFDPRLKISKQVNETLSCRLGLTKSQSNEVIIEKLLEMNLTSYERILESYPRQISGGMLQRIAVALVLAMEPQYILADEPTSALDEENRNILVDVLKKEKESRGILFISHDISAIETLCDNVIVMGGGKVVESGYMKELRRNPKNIWTKELSKVIKSSEEREFVWKEF